MKKFLLSLLPPALVSLIQREPAVVISGIVTAAGDVAVQLGFSLTRTETIIIQAAAAIVLSLITRALVTPTASVPSTGVSEAPAAPVAPTLTSTPEA
jgi:hypothetical protein